MEGMIENIPWGIGYRSEKFGLVSLDDGYVGRSCTSPCLFIKQSKVSCPCAGLESEWGSVAIA
jgi:hypothetical protein